MKPRHEGGGETRQTQQCLRERRMRGNREKGRGGIEIKEEE